MKKEKLISLLLTGVITVTMFAGCGKQNDSTEKKEGDGKISDRKSTRLNSSHTS